MEFTNTYLDIEEYAKSVSKTITTKEYYRTGYNGEHIPDENGDSYYEVTRTPTAKEAKIITGIIEGALRSIKYYVGSEIATEEERKQMIAHAADTAEFISLNLLPDIQSYLSIYLPIKNYQWIEKA